jgi:prepilin-type N-terminal cleavage/methylation domain-containing protein
MNRPIKRGFTLIELVIALFAASFLLAGMSSAVFISLRATSPALSTQDATIEGHKHLAMMIADLETALAVTEQTATAVTVSVPDRDVNGSPETVRYSWSGVAGAPLMRDSTIPVIEDVHSFTIEYVNHLPEDGEPARLAYLQIALQVGSGAAAGITTSVPLMNKP